MIASALAAHNRHTDGPILGTKRRHAPLAAQEEEAVAQLEDVGEKWQSALLCAASLMMPYLKRQRGAMPTDTAQTAAAASALLRMTAQKPTPGVQGMMLGSQQTDGSGGTVSMPSMDTSRCGVLVFVKVFRGSKNHLPK